MSMDPRDPRAHPAAAHDPAAIQFALNRLTQAKGAGLIGGDVQIRHDPNLLIAQFHKYNPSVAHQIHMGASLQQPHVAPLPAPMPHGVQPQTASYSSGGYSPAVTPVGHPGAQQAAQGGPLPQHVAGAVPGTTPPPVDPMLLVLNKLLGLPT